MKVVFADSFYFIALLSPADSANSRATTFTANYTGKMVTTTSVLTEVADALARPGPRGVAAKFIDNLFHNKAMQVVWLDNDLFQASLTLYRARPDKEWSFTDCGSFVVMTRQGITEALTADHHFEQAGFMALLK